MPGTKHEFALGAAPRAQAVHGEGGEDEGIREEGGFFEGLRGPSVADPEQRAKRRRLGFYFAVFAILVALQVSVRLRIQALGYSGRDLTRLIEKLDQEGLELQAQVTRESGAAVIGSRARDLGMREARPGQVRRIDEQP